MKSQEMGNAKEMELLQAQLSALQTEQGAGVGRRPQGRVQHFVHSLIHQFFGMCSLQQVVRHILAIIVLVVAFGVAAHKLPQDFVLQYGVYLNWVIGVTLGIVIIKSASYSLALPLLALFIGASTIPIAHYFQGTVFTLEASFYFRLLVVGLVGLIVGAISVD
jgi:hypothetical protein